MTITSPARPGCKRGRKSVDIVAATGYRTPQDVIWELIRQLVVFARVDIDIQLFNQNKKGINSHTVESYIQRLLKGNYIAIKSIEKIRGSARIHFYELINDVGLRAPRLKADGAPSVQGLGRENVWRAMKMLPSFDYIDLARAATTQAVWVKQGEARDYIKHLAKAGYLQTVVPAKRGGSTKGGTKGGASPARYRLVSSKNTGPLPPMVQRIKSIFDPNLNKIVWDAERGPC